MPGSRRLHEVGWSGGGSEYAVARRLRMGGEPGNGVHDRGVVVGQGTYKGRQEAFVPRTQGF